MPPSEGGLVLFPGALGDAVCLEPAIAWLAARLPVTLYARGGAAEVAALYPAPVVVRSLDAVEIARLFAPADDARTTAWLGCFSRIVSFTGADNPSVAGRLRATGRAVVERFPRPPIAEHAADLFLRAVGGDPVRTPAVPRLVAPAAAARGGPRLLALLPGSGGRAKRAPSALYASLASRWCGEGGAVAVVLGPAEEGEDATWRGVGRIVRPESVAELARLLAGATAFVGNDAGPSHVAAGLGTPGVVLYTSTEPGQFGPRGMGVAVVPLADGEGAAVEAAWRLLRVRLP